MNLTDGSTALTLPDDLEWNDEYTWQPVSQSAEYSITGALVLDVGLRASGRPITLTGETVWVARSVVDQLRIWASTPGLPLTLTLADARVIPVLFRHHDGAGLQAKPVLYTAPSEASDQYTITLNLMEIPTP